MFRPIYPPRGRAQEYCDLAVNIYTGCPHRCSYCYVPGILRKQPEAFHSDVRPRLGIVEAVKKHLGGMHDQGRKIMLSFTCDPYPIGYDTTVTREVIQAIKESGNHVQILTKGNQTAQRDLDLLDGNDSFGVTLAGDCDEVYEKRASHEVHRIKNVYTAYRKGIQTWVSCEPVITASAIKDYIRDMHYVGLWRIGKLNHRKSDIDWCAFGHEVEDLCKRLGRNYYIKEDLRLAMQRRDA